MKESGMFDAILTTMEAAWLKSMGMSAPKIEALPDRDYRAVMIIGERRVEALGTTPEGAARRVIRMAVAK